MNENEFKISENLTLVLMYLSKFKMNKEAELYSAWKGYDFDVLDSLGEKELIIQGNTKNKSIVITEAGEEKAKQILELVRTLNF